MKNCTLQQGQVKIWCTTCKRKAIETGSSGARLNWEFSLSHNHYWDGQAVWKQDGRTRPVKKVLIRII